MGVARIDRVGGRGGFLWDLLGLQFRWVRWESGLGSYGSITRTSAVDDEGGMFRAGGAVGFSLLLDATSLAGSFCITALRPDCLKNHAFSVL